jgi:hypothetical protein
MAKIVFKKTKAQAEVFDDDITSTIVFSGGLGSGKTYVLCNKMLKLSYINRGFSGGLLVPDYPSFRKDVQPTFDDIFQKNGIKYKFNRQENAYYFPWNRKPLYIFTAEKPIAGPNLAYSGINEYSLMKYDRIKEMTRRVRLKGAKCLQSVLAGTPEDVFGWLEEYKENMEKQNKERPNAFKIVYGSTKDNIYLSDHYLDDLRATLDEQALKVFTEGAIIKIGGNYFYYSFSREKNVSEQAIYQKGQMIHVGLDFNVGNMSATFSHKIVNNGRAEQHFFEELVLKGDSNTYTIAEAVIKRFPWEYQNGLLLVTCDASGSARKSSATEQLQSDVAILQSKKLRVRYKQVNPRLRERQLLMNGLFYHGVVKINPKCKELIKDFTQVMQEPKDFSKVKSDPNRTHLSDTADYVCDFEYDLPDRIRKPISTQGR